MKAIFIGSDGSMGLKHGKCYEIETDILNNMIVVKFKHEICPYASVKAFLKNWKVVE